MDPIKITTFTIRIEEFEDKSIKITPSQPTIVYQEPAPVEEYIRGHVKIGKVFFNNGLIYVKGEIGKALTLNEEIKIEFEEDVIFTKVSSSGMEVGHQKRLYGLTQMKNKYTNIKLGDILLAYYYPKEHRLVLRSQDTSLELAAQAAVVRKLLEGQQVD